jgi:uncharacterized delta-60 repeat protein
MKSTDSMKKCRSISIAVLHLIFLLSVVLARDAVAASGDLDPTFGIGGKVTTDFNGAQDGANSIAIQADGKIVAAGYSGAGTSWSFALARYNSDGTLDATFGTGGKVTTDFGGFTAIAQCVAIQADGKIVAGGRFYTGPVSDFALARYNSDGTLDITFGSGGKVTTDFMNGSLDEADGIAIQTDGKIVVAGSSNLGTTVDFALARYNSDGTLDTTFGSGGKVTTGFIGVISTAHCIAVQADGKIVAAGSTAITLTGSDFALARYNSDGTLDITFGSGGKVTTDFYGADDVVFGIAVQVDGKIVAAGFSWTGDSSRWDFALARYNSDGTLDTSFGSAGKVTTDINNNGSRDSASGIAIQADGKIVAVGTSAPIDDGWHFALARYNSDGTLDATFGSGGKVTTDFNSGSDDFASGISIQADGKIVAAGSSAYADFALARYIGSNTPIGSNVTVPLPPVTVTFDNVTSPGTTTATVSVSGTPLPNGFKLGNPPVFYSIETTAGYTGQIHICINYTGVSYGNESMLRLLHETPTGWVDITDPGYPDMVNKIICGTVSSFSHFGVFEPSYSFTGFLPPVENPPVMNTAKAGQTVPVKWQLTDSGGSYISDLSVVTGITFQQVQCSDVSTALTNEVSTTTSGSSGLHYDTTANQFVYNWMTDKSMAGNCYLLTLTLYGFDKHEAYFNIK